MPELLRLFIHGACWGAFAATDAAPGDRIAFAECRAATLWNLAAKAEVTPAQLRCAFAGRAVPDDAAARLWAALGLPAHA